MILCDKYLRDRMVVGFTSPLKFWVRTPFMSRYSRYNIMWFKFVSDLRQVGVFLRSHRFPPPIKLTATI